MAENTMPEVLTSCRCWLFGEDRREPDDDCQLHYLRGLHREWAEHECPLRAVDLDSHECGVGEGEPGEHAYKACEARDVAVVGTLHEIEQHESDAQKHAVAYQGRIDVGAYHFGCRSAVELNDGDQHEHQVYAPDVGVALEDGHHSFARLPGAFLPFVGTFWGSYWFSSYRFADVESALGVVCHLGFLLRMFWLGVQRSLTASLNRRPRSS